MWKKVFIVLLVCTLVSCTVSYIAIKKASEIEVNSDPKANSELETKSGIRVNTPKPEKEKDTIPKT